jgi:hypothetical protein
VSARVTARTWIQEWEVERDALTQRRDYAQAQMLPLVDARNKARGDLELAQGAKTGLAFAMCIPFESPVGQATQAYVGYRQVRLNHVLLLGDRTHPEYESAVAELHEVAAFAGYSLVEDVHARQLAESIRSNLPDATAAAADPVPSMTEVLALDKAAMQNVALQAQPNVVEDHRRPAAPRPRNEVVPPARQVQTLRDLGVR